MSLVYLKPCVHQQVAIVLIEEERRAPKGVENTTTRSTDATAPQEQGPSPDGEPWVDEVNMAPLHPSWEMAAHWPQLDNTKQ